MALMVNAQTKFNDRLLDLYEMASDEGIILNDDSITEMDSFLESVPVIPDHFNFTDDGILYCTWKDPKTENWMEIEFHSDNKCKVYKFQKTEDSILIVPDIDLFDINVAKEMLMDFVS